MIESAINYYAVSITYVVTKKTILSGTAHTSVPVHFIINNYSSNNPRDEVEGIIRQYSPSLRRIIVLV